MVFCILGSGVKKDNTAAIIGGVVAAVGVIVIVAIMIVIMVILAIKRRNIKGSIPSTPYFSVLVHALIF